MTKQKETWILKHFKPYEVLCISQAWIALSERRKTTEDNTWKAIAKLCNERFEMTKSDNYLLAKWDRFKVAHMYE